MARSFNGSTQHANTSTSFPTIEPPLTMAYWGFCTSASHASVGLALGRFSGASSATMSVGMRGDVSGGPVRVTHVGNPDGGVFPFADSTTGYSINTWHHACGVFASDSSRSAFIDGGSKATNTTAISGVNNSDSAIIATQRTNGFFTRYFLGRIAYPCIWNVALSDAEVLSLARGTHPSLVRPEAITALWDLTGGFSPEPDRFGGWDATLVNSPSVVDNPRIILPGRGRSFVSFGGAPPPTTFKPYWRQTPQLSTAGVIG
jgi:hypothetical protein